MGKQLWQWNAINKFGKPREYQAHGADVTEAEMLEFLRAHFHGCAITDLKRLPDGAYKPPTGIVESHTYDFGVLRKLGMVYDGDGKPEQHSQEQIIRTVPRRTIERVCRSFDANRHS